MNQSLPARLLFALLATVAVRAPAQTPSAIRTDSTPPRLVVMPKLVEVPMLAGRDGSARPMVEVMINGEGPFRFIVETGARSIDMAQSLIDSLKLTHIGRGPDEPQYHVDSINVGTASFKDITVNAAPAGIAALGIVGVLGLPFYQNILLTLDYPGQKIRLSRDTLAAADGRDILQLQRISDFWGLPIAIAGHEQLAVLDTQNSGTFQVPPPIADALPFDGGQQVIGKARGAFGTIDVKGGSLAGNVMIGKFTFPAPFLNIMQLPPDYPNRVNVGSGLLKYFVVSIDQRSARLRLSHNGPDLIQLPAPARRGAP